MEASSFLGTRPQNTVVFEDALYAVMTAGRAGFQVVGVYDTYSDNDTVEIQKNVNVYMQELSSDAMWNYFKV